MAHHKSFSINIFNVHQGGLFLQACDESVFKVRGEEKHNIPFSDTQRHVLESLFVRLWCADLGNYWTQQLIHQFQHFIRVLSVASNKI